MKYVSVCSGIEAATVAWHPLGWTPLWFAETEAFPSAVLTHHYPEVPNRGDITQYQTWPDLETGAIALLVGGTPCQSFSVAGLRKGLDDPRGSLLFAYLAIARRYRPRWLVWENVPGVLSIDDGRAFGSLLGGLADLGYGFAYRILDAQYFGVAQRRARVFVVGYLGDWRPAAAVLVECESVSWHPAPSREAGEGITGSLAARTSAGGGLGTDFDIDGGLILERARALTSSSQRLDSETETFIVRTLAASGGGMDRPAGQGNELDFLIPIDLRQASRGEKLTNNRAQGSGGAPGHGIGNHADPAFTVSERGQAIAFDWQSGGDARGLDPKETAQLQRSQVPAIQHTMHVRRLTPRECERLQGFPDDYTLIPYRGKPAADGPRYKALGNSMAVPVMTWIGQRIQHVEQILEDS